MRLLIWEYFCSGAVPQNLADQSLLNEGKAMLSAFLTDCSYLDSLKLVTMLDQRLQADPLQGIETVWVSNVHQELQLFQQLVQESDACMVIAPEFDNLLLNRRKMVDQMGSQFLGCSQSAIKLCSDKFLLYEYLTALKIPTIPTQCATRLAEFESIDFPLIIKPRDGAGALNTFLIAQHSDLSLLETKLATEGQRAELIAQPYLPGVACSLNVIASSAVDQLTYLPLVKQNITLGEQLKYCGGTVPFTHDLESSAQQFVKQVWQAIPGLEGYVGFDLLFPEGEVEQPCLIEINPRLTTSYLGYRSLTDTNLAKSILFREQLQSSISWKQTEVSFDSRGSVWISKESERNNRKQK